ncbi:MULTISPECIES: NAD(P)/FAD-dependent oxidoreductase [Nitrincola]|uniref:Sulfide dehydrogenase [flavocytochrome c] flavoprotein chain n=1 Tax=Nitrincola nitratireducens TaxID=1229521 RepID=W9URY6_9GAMM|nr:MULTISPECIES: NAD(P)/FAD-dependent oxidoreductase [Nitrincola]EXJ09834.1 Sulfide dehydrogenase [flavocytochrome c] flavoprotein chain precursor [Nitrincola nitratireducens]
MSNKNTSFSTSRRRLLKGLGMVGLLPAIPTIAASTSGHAGHVIVVGGGFGGATAAKYIKRGNPKIDVTLIEPNSTFYTCPFSNLVLAGERSLDSIGHNYDELKNVFGVKVIHAFAEDIDGVAHKVTLSTGEVLSYDRLLLSPGIDMRWNAIEGYDQAASEKAPHAWKAGNQTLLLRKQLEEMEDGGTFVMSVPADPFRCPPGPYERASLVAHYLKHHKPRSKILILDSKDSFSKQGLFTNAWKEIYGDMIEWVGVSGDGRVVRVDADKREVETEFGTLHSASALNIIPPQKAGFIADRAGVTNESGWVPVNPNTFESQQVADIYVVGDATIAAPMPKSGFAANTQGKVAAAAIVASLAGITAPDPYWANTCYSLVNPDYGISVAGVYKVEDNQIITVPGSGGLSAADASSEIRQAEAAYAVGWYEAITQDTWGTKY